MAGCQGLAKEDIKMLALSTNLFVCSSSSTTTKRLS
jgi:hypothetical protein